jgi:hypothetical protein
MERNGTALPFFTEFYTNGASVAPTQVPRAVAMWDVFMVRIKNNYVLLRGQPVMMWPIRRLQTINELSVQGGCPLGCCPV